jgi:catechol 2,3-dioxygenase
MINHQRIAGSTRMGPVHLTVGDIERSIEYYRRTLGLAVLDRSNGSAAIGAGGLPLLVLVEEPGAQPSPHSTGLFHFALLVPERRDLAAWLAYAARERVPLDGLSDHAVSEAIYLHDPDLHGIEIYHDRPRDGWDGRVGQLLTTLPLDVQALLDELPDPQHAEFDGLPAGTVMGHVHLQVADVPEAVGFHRDVLGFDLMAQLRDQAAFLSAGGYHHHVGANVWNSRGAGPPPPGSASLRMATVILPDAAERDRVAGRVADSGQEPESRPDGVLVRDPSGNALLLAVAGGE